MAQSTRNSAGCTHAVCEYRKMVMNSCLKTFTSGTMKADDNDSSDTVGDNVFG